MKKNNMNTTITLNVNLNKFKKNAVRSVLEDLLYDFDFLKESDRKAAIKEFKVEEILLNDSELTKKLVSAIEKHVRFALDGDSDYLDESLDDAIRIFVENSKVYQEVYKALALNESKVKEVKEEQAEKELEIFKAKLEKLGYVITKK